MYTVELAIPSKRFHGFREKIESHWMRGDSPVLSRHVPMSDGKQEFASFSSEYAEDLDWVLSVLPRGGAVMDFERGWIQCNPVRGLIHRAFQALERLLMAILP